MKRAALALMFMVACALAPVVAQSSEPRAVVAQWHAPGEFEPQDYIWLSWREEGFLGAAPFSDTTLAVMKAITPYVKVRLMFSDEQPPYSFGSGRSVHLPVDQARARLSAILARNGIDPGRVDFFHHPQPYGAIQDPGPFFLRRNDGGLMIADYGFDHPDPRTEAIDRTVAAALGLPTVKSDLVSEGGDRQSNGRGTLLLVRAVEIARNPGRSLEWIEAEHKRVTGAVRIVWLEQGPAEEEWGKLSDGRWGIGTGGHVDVFARFADAHTILLSRVSEAQRRRYPILAETSRRMERNLAILKAETDQDGQPFRILRVPVPDPMIARADFDALSPEEKSWFDGAKPGDTLEYYLPGGYQNFIIANEVVVTARFGQPVSDRRAREALQAAFPGRQIVQIDVDPLLHDGAGLHCHSRNQPKPASE